MSSPVADDFYREVTDAVEDTPYVVTRTDRGFDVRLDLADARWFGLLHQAGLRKAFTHHVTVSASSFAITDSSAEVRWEAGHPRIVGTSTRELGRRIELSSEKVWAIREDGTFGKVVDYSFSSEEGRNLVSAVGKQLGLTQERGIAEKIGLYAALSVPVGFVVAAAVVAVLALR